MKYKVGDKVRVVKVNYEDDIKTKDLIGRVYEISTICKNDRGYGLYGSVCVWQENELELVTEEPTLFDRIKSSIIEAGKQAPIIIEQTEDGGIKISPIEEKPQPRESGIYIDPELPHIHVIFGGRIHVGVGECKAENGYTIGLQELEELKECGGRHDEEWVKEKPTVNLIINNKNTIKILRDALNIIENKLNKED